MNLCHTRKWETFSMMTSSNGNIFHVTGPLCGEFAGTGEFPSQRPVMRSFDVFFDLRLNKRLNKQPWGWWFETPSWPLWRQFNAPYWKWKYVVRYFHVNCNGHLEGILQILLYIHANYFNKNVPVLPMLGYDLLQSNAQRYSGGFATTLYTDVFISHEITCWWKNMSLAHVSVRKQ